jgi:ribose 5-phosphate isomerase RpiB
MIICAWLDSEFEGGRSQRKVERMRAIENETYDGAA